MYAGRVAATSVEYTLHHISFFWELKTIVLKKWGGGWEESVETVVVFT